MTTILKLKNILSTQEGRTLPVGTEGAGTDEFAAGLHNAWTRIILVADARYHVREEDLAYARGEPSAHLFKLHRPRKDKDGLIEHERPPVPRER